MRNFIVSLVFGLLAFIGQGQQVQLDPTGAGEAILSNAFSVTSPNSYVVAGAMTSPGGEFGFVTRFSKTDVMWSKKFQVGTRLNSMVIASNSDVVVAGSISDVGGTKILIARLSISGETLWITKVGSDTLYKELSRSIIEDEDGSFIIGGLSGDPTNRQQNIIRVSATGGVVENYKQEWMPYTHLLDEVFIRNGNTFVFGVERVNSSSSFGNISLRILGSSLTEVCHKAYGDLFASDGIPSVVMLPQGAIVATTVSNGFGLISLDQNFDIVSSSSLRYQEASGANLQNPRLVQDESGYLYIGGGALFNSMNYAIVSKIDPVSLNVLWTRTLHGNGFVSSDMSFDGSTLVVPSTNGSSVTTVSFVNKETGQIVGTPCDMFLPSFTLEQSSYPNLAEVTYPVTPWSNPELSLVYGVSESELPIDVSDCEPILLPVELTHFTAQVDEGMVKLFWSTATEHNNSHFIIERTRDNEAWEVVAHVSGAGNSQSATNYEARDEQPYSGTSYYRLKQVDFDGAYAYSEAISVSVEEHEFVLSPNPITSGQVLRGMGEKEFQITNLGGQVVYQGSGQSPINLSSGTYVVRLVGDETRFARLLVTN